MIRYRRDRSSKRVREEKKNGEKQCNYATEFELKFKTILEKKSCSQKRITFIREDDFNVGIICYIIK